MVIRDDGIARRKGTGSFLLQTNRRHHVHHIMNAHPGEIRRRLGDRLSRCFKKIDFLVGRQKEDRRASRAQHRDVIKHRSQRAHKTSKEGTVHKSEPHPLDEHTVWIQPFLDQAEKFLCVEMRCTRSPWVRGL